MQPDVSVAKLESTARTVKVDMKEAREASVVMRPCAWVRYPADTHLKRSIMSLRTK